MANEARKLLEERLEHYEMRANAMRIAIEDLDELDHGRRVPRQRSVMQQAKELDVARRNGTSRRTQHFRGETQNEEPLAEMQTPADEKEVNDPHEDRQKKKKANKAKPPENETERRQRTLAVLETLDYDEPRPVPGTGRAGALLRSGHIKKKGKKLYVRTNLPFTVRKK